MRAPTHPAAIRHRARALQHRQVSPTSTETARSSSASSAPATSTTAATSRSFVDGAKRFGEPKDWKVIARGNVSTADALSAARALCAQKVDMVALGAGSLSDAIPASEEPACEKTVWYVPAQGNIAQTPRILLSEDSVNQNLLAAGHAAGMLMKDKNLDTAGFVGGLDVEFEQRASVAFKAGVRSVLPDAKVLISFAGDQNDSAKAKEATQAQLRQGAKVIYPYLGGSTDAAARLANETGVLTLTPGTDRCASTDPKFDISVIFDPGSYLTAALQQFADGKMEVGTKKTWMMGVDEVPTVKFCNGTDEQNKQLRAVHVRHRLRQDRRRRRSQAPWFLRSRSRAPGPQQRSRRQPFAAWNQQGVRQGRRQRQRGSVDQPRTDPRSAG
ncbi:BMP family ABC transporter substrate-binding protein [Aeromicrobium sp. UC242_57]|uniref:BMP family ABC transporter substrate-binding protein n=1 Tax=Aeromicrobium sp. UC242_57 TaxID=3374624 RepID=UPI0037B7B154